MPSWRTSEWRHSSSWRPELIQRVSPRGWLAVSGISPAQCSLVAASLRPLVVLDRADMRRVVGPGLGPSTLRRLGGVRRTGE